MNRIMKALFGFKLYERVAPWSGLYPTVAPSPHIGLFQESRRVNASETLEQSRCPFCTAWAPASILVHRP